MDRQRSGALHSLVGLHAVQTAHARLWSFAVPMVFAAQQDQTSLAALAGFNTSIQFLKLLILPFLGGLADSMPLRQVAIVSVFGHAAVVLNCVIILSFFSSVDAAVGGGMPRALALVVLLSAASELLKEFSSIALEMRVAPQSSSGGQNLVRVNSLVKQTELIVKLIVPLAFGWYASRSSAVKPLVSLVLVAHVASALAAATLWQRMLSASGLTAASASAAKDDAGPKRWHLPLLCSPVAGMSLAYALLFCSVLSDHDPVFTAHLAAAGLAPGVLGAARSASALTGLVGTWLWPLLQSAFGTLRGAALALCCFALALLGVLERLRGSAPGLALVFVTASRPFLWAFDLAMVSILQDFVPLRWRGKAAAMQGVACQVFELMIASAAMVFPRFEQFWVIASVSFAAVLASSLLFFLCVLAQEKRTKESLPVNEYTA